MSGKWWEGHRCPICGATLLKNDKGDVWCSFVECVYKRNAPTNFDRITSSPEALAKAFAHGCPREDWRCKGRSCERCWFDYLNSLAESDKEDSQDA